jgi:predicted lipid carrier protein YhbT
MDKITEFQGLFEKFLEATQYMIKKRQERGRTSEFERLEEKFIKRVVEPMDKAWLELTEQERLMVFDPPEEDTQVKKVLEMFKGTVVREIQKERKICQ